MISIQIFLIVFVKNDRMIPIHTTDTNSTIRTTAIGY